MTDRRTMVIGISALTLLAPPAFAQSSAVTPPGGQVERVRKDDRAPVDQLSAPRDRGYAPTQLTPRAAPRGVVQVSTARRNAATTQVNPARRDAQPTTQLSGGRATADASQPLSRPAEGRRQSVVRLGGRDRCDPQTEAKRPADCARVIETRSGEFVRPDPLVLSPEQRLLVDQRLREAPPGPRAQVQRIGNNAIDTESMDAQGIASLTLPRPVTPAERDAAATDPTTGVTDATAAAIVQAIIDGGGRTPTVVPNPR